MLRVSFFIFSALLLLGQFAERKALAVETVISDSYCRIQNFQRPLRQTIVILDQANVVATSSGAPMDANRRWINLIITLAGVQEGHASAISAPRERITVLVALQDGSDLVRIFSGCPPTFSQSEIELVEKDSTGFTGTILKFVGKNFRSQIDSDQKSFRSSLLGALVQVPKIGPLKDSASDEQRNSSTFLSSLSSINGSFNLSDGIPRFFIISPMGLQLLHNFQDAKDARQAGFNLASKLGSDLQRAEVYVTGLDRNAGKFSREFSHAFFLGIKGRLVAASGEALPPVADTPIAVQVFGGFIDYGGVKAPMQLRLAIDQSGSLVSSWVEIAVDRALATPLTGKAICSGEKLEKCEVKGDGKEFSQSWVVDVGPSPKFEQTLPFSGLRYFEFVTSANGVKGRFYDPIVVINGQKELVFELSRTANVRF